jgi:hypothetical protein
MTQATHGGVRPGAGRKPTSERRVKRAITLSAATDTLVLANQHPSEAYSQTIERLLNTITAPALPPIPVQSPMLAALVAHLTPEYQVVAGLYRTLGWSRQQFEHLIQTERSILGQLGVRLHVATKDAASGRRERYITVDGVRYSALSWQRYRRTEME